TAAVRGPGSPVLVISEAQGELIVEGVVDSKQVRSDIDLVVVVRSSAIPVRREERVAIERRDQRDYLRGSIAEEAGRNDVGRTRNRQPRDRIESKAGSYRDPAHILEGGRVKDLALVNRPADSVRADLTGRRAAR